MWLFFVFRLEKKPNAELIMHDMKRRVEVKCMELQVTLLFDRLLQDASYTNVVISS